MITLSCQEFLARISDFIDGELDGPWRQAVSEHARACPQCAVILDTTERTVHLAGEAELFAMPPQVADRLHARIAAALRAMPEAADPAAEAAWDAAPAAVLMPPAAPAPAEVVPPVRKAGFLGGWNWPLAWAVAGAILIIFGGVNWWQQARVHTLQGWLIDAHCAAHFVATGTAPTNHERWCLLQPLCSASGYGVLTAQGVFWRFNPAGNRDAMTMLQSNAPAKDLRVIVRGQERGHRLFVRAMRWAQPKGLISVRLRLPAYHPAAARAAAYLPAYLPALAP